MDQPIDIRTADSFLFSFKRMLTIDWGYNKNAVRVNTDTKVLSVAGKDIVKAAVANYALTLEWCDDEWQTWEPLQSATEFTKIKTDVRDRLDRAKQAASGSSKGKGKCPE